MSKLIRPQEALDYHSRRRVGKIEVIPTKPTNTQRDLALAYSPGVAEPCKEIANNVNEVYKYTAKGNLVAVITNGTAVLGLGDIGPEAAKPVMEGKGVLFKVFADIDVFDLELNVKSVDDFVNTVKALEPTFGGINLEDIAAPECFEIERRLKEEMGIPVMHDDQHGTAIITAAGLLNALILAKKTIEEVRIVVNGAGAAAISCARLLLTLGAAKEHIIMLDRSGVISTRRKKLTDLKAEFAQDLPEQGLAEAMKGADVFLGLSMGNILSAEMVQSMAERPIVFAMANPDPEIAYETAMESRADIIMATGRSDHPNQVNNVLGFPFIFRGALDVRASQINEAMKLAAVHAIAELARKPVPDMVKMAYNQPQLAFNENYIIPKPIDPRLIYTVAPAVAKAAMESGVALNPITDWVAYEEELKARMGIDNSLIRAVMNRAKKEPKRVVFPEGNSLQVLQAAQVLQDENIAQPIILGNEEEIQQICKINHIDISSCKVIDPYLFPKDRERYGQVLFTKRQRKGYTSTEAYRTMSMRSYFALGMLELGDADAVVTGHTRKYKDVLTPALQIIGSEPGLNRVAGLYILITKKGVLFFADPTVNVNPTAQALVDITQLAARAVKNFNIEPKIAMLSYSNFGSARTKSSSKVAEAVRMLQKIRPDLLVDGELQANFALNKDLLKAHFPFSTLVGNKINTLIFPAMSSGNIAYKLLQELGGIESIGPVLLGMNKPVHILQMGCSAREIVNVAAVAVMDAQIKDKNL